MPSGDQLKTWAEFSEAVLTAVGILLGGIWTYMLFVRKRERFPRARLKHLFTSFLVRGKLGLLSVTIEISNIGTTLMRLEEAKCRVQQVLPLDGELSALLDRGDDIVPLDSQSVPWPTLDVREWKFKKGAVEIEPGESEVLRAEFLVPSYINRLLIYSYIGNRSKGRKRLGWEKVSFLSLKKGVLDDVEGRDQPTSTAVGSRSGQDDSEET
jgi:hypothetical protein